MSGTDLGAGTSHRRKDEPEEAQPQSHAAANTTTPEPYLVLLVDDEGPITETLAVIVEESGYSYLIAAHGKEALALVHTRWPALVITDLMMPQMNGTQLIAALHQEAAQRHVAAPPIVLMTAAGVRVANSSGADIVINKPFDVPDIEDLLRRFLGPPPDN